MNKIKKGLLVLRNDGISVFLRRFIDLLFIQTKGVMSGVYIGTMYFSIRTKMRNFGGGSPEDLLAFISKNFFGYFKPAQVQSEFVALLDVFSRKKPKVVLEIGTFRGGTLFCFTRLASLSALIISLDLPGGTFGGGYGRLREKIYHAFTFPKQELRLLREDSHSEGTLEKVKKILSGERIDFLFIDGDHTYEGVKRDFEMYAPLMEKGGIIALHDVAAHPKETGCFVNLFWEEVKRSYHCDELIENENQGWGGIGVVYF